MRPPSWNAPIAALPSGFAVAGDMLDPLFGDVVAERDHAATPVQDQRKPGLGHPAPSRFVPIEADIDRDHLLDCVPALLPGIISGIASEWRSAIGQTDVALDPVHDRLLLGVADGGSGGGCGLRAIAIVLRGRLR